MARPASDNTTAVWKFLRGKGFTPAQTAGIIGGLKGESGPGLNPSARNPSSGAIGIGQWLGGRARGVRPGDLHGQLQHLWSELQGPERGALQRVKQAHTIEGAVDAWVRGFERPSAGEIASSIGSRKSMARETFNRLSGVAGSASTPGGGGGSGGSGGSTRTTTTTTPGVDNSLARLALVQSFLGNKNADVLDFASQAKGLADVPGTTSTQTEKLPGQGGIGGGPAGSAAGGSLAATAASRADVIDRQRLPYSWGGGHGGQTKISDPVPLDCSGAVSKVLGIDPRVSGQFGSWGRPGDGGSKGVTVYSNGHHVLMKINGHFFGTSRTNPGGGAGWIPQNAISPQYLKGFTARHSNR